MKVSFGILTVIVFAAFLVSSCKGSAGKKAATETIEFIEKESSHYGDDVGKLLDEEGTKAVKSYESKPRMRRLHHGNDDASSYQQPTIVMCGQCNGTGMVYLLDGYGNIMTDYYGNPQIAPCPACGGSGQQTVYQ